MTYSELQLEGLVGPTHNYAGLSFGNVASASNAGDVSNPRAAALQSLEKMKFVHELGAPVAVFPPCPRPRFDVLKRLGFSGNDATMLSAAWAQSPELVANIWSASCMWAANAATVTPSCDATDGALHLTPANLFSTLHRSIESRDTKPLLEKLFPAAIVHEPLPVTTRLADEGAANHMRFCATDGTQGVQVMVYGASPDSKLHPAHFPARQQKAASEAVMRAHTANTDKVLYWQQLPEAIDAGVFHNDVIAMSHNNLLIAHEKAFVDQPQALASLKKLMPEIKIRQISCTELPLADAVKSYFFNAQLLSAPDGSVIILFPSECEERPQVKALCEQLMQEGLGVSAVYFLNLRESMRNGGGPACLRLRVPTTTTERAAMHPGAMFDLRLYNRLKSLVESRYRDRIAPADLSDIAFAQEALAVQGEILTVLGL